MKAIWYQFNFTYQFDRVDSCECLLDDILNKQTFTNGALISFMSKLLFSEQQAAFIMAKSKLLQLPFFLILCLEIITFISRKTYNFSRIFKVFTKLLLLLYSELRVMKCTWLHASIHYLQNSNFYPTHQMRSDWLNSPLKSFWINISTQRNTM